MIAANSVPMPWVPSAHVKDGYIRLAVSVNDVKAYNATADAINFEASFNGQKFFIMLPYTSFVSVMMLVEENWLVFGTGITAGKNRQPETPTEETPAPEEKKKSFLTVVK